MRHHPERERFRAAATDGKTMVPVWRELVLDGDTPVSAFAKVGGGEGSFLLESAVGGSRWAAYSFLGLSPRATLTVGSGRATLRTHSPETGEERVESWDERDPVAALGRLVERYPAAPDPSLPRFFGGAVGFLAWDAVRAWEPVPARAEDDLGIPDAIFVVPDLVVVFDNLRQMVRVIAGALADGVSTDRAYDAACARADALVARLLAPAPRLLPLDLDAPRSDPPASRTPRDRFLDGVRRAKEHILDGDAFQIVLSQRFEAARAGADPFDVYRALRATNPSPYLYHLVLPGLVVTGASPETLVRVEGRRVEVRPIAGTRPRGRTADEDARLAAELAADEKENAEHVMLIDLGRNDVGRVAATGSVRVEEERVVERYSHVMHLVSLVSGELAEGSGAVDVLRAAFPAGTLSGAPKVRAMQIIEQLEPLRRGVYGGAVGYVGFPVDGRSNLDFAIAIRTLVTLGERVLVQAGAGIVHDSVPESEYQETVNKARAVVRAIEIARAASHVVADR